MKVKNATTFPKIYYGIHFCPGVAEYRDPEKGAYRIFVNEAAIREMNPTFAGKPVYVRHVDEVDLKNIQTEADGYVVESFYNALDGKTWAKFIIVADAGHEAIKKGWRLSNAYIPTKTTGGGIWNGVEYVKEILGGEFEHLAIVDDPRYESMILTPEEFKAYNSEKELELKRVANSKEKKGDISVKFNFFKRTKVENSSDLEGMMVKLPKTGKELELETIINEYDKVLNMQGYANGEHMVKVGDEEMSVNALVEKYMGMCKNADAEKAEEGEKKENLSAEEDESAKKKAEELVEHEKKEIEEKKENEDPEKEEKEEKKQNSKHFNDLKNSPFQNMSKSVDLSMDKVARGKSRYGR